MAKKKILFTGRPGCGKSTLIEKILGKLNRPATGFITREIREGGIRCGFEIITLDGKKGILAHREIHSPFRVGPYYVNIGDIENIAVPSIIPSTTDEVIVIDEIGKMECLSPLFRETLLKAFESENLLIGSIALKGDSFIEGIKGRRDVVIIPVTEKNREEIALKYPGILLTGEIASP
jgi:nucleoside-triphosphatase